MTVANDTLLFSSPKLLSFYVCILTKHYHSYCWL